MCGDSFLINKYFSKNSSRHNYINVIVSDIISYSESCLVCGCTNSKFYCSYPVTHSDAILLCIIKLYHFVLCFMFVEFCVILRSQTFDVCNLVTFLFYRFQKWIYFMCCIMMSLILG